VIRSPRTQGLPPRLPASIVILLVVAAAIQKPDYQQYAIAPAQRRPVNYLILIGQVDPSARMTWPDALSDLRELAVETRMNSPSIFDLSPSEKLQLVEDLWDDLASAPETVPVHDWQKQELARRKANLMNHPDSGRQWGEVKRNIRAHNAR
jgi:putative addiction module component (TIGR02574 family)